jgi:hypothetical protein
LCVRFYANGTWYFSFFVCKLLETNYSLFVLWHLMCAENWILCWLYDRINSLVFSHATWHYFLISKSCLCISNRRQKKILHLTPFSVSFSIVCERGKRGFSALEFSLEAYLFLFRDDRTVSFPVFFFPHNPTFNMWKELYHKIAFSQLFILLLDRVLQVNSLFHCTIYEFNSIRRRLFNQ